MRNQTVLDILRRIRTENRDFRTEATKALLGMTVLTRYNNKTYRIDEVDFNASPNDTFPMKDGRNVSYVEYYRVSFVTIFKILIQRISTY